MICVIALPEAQKFVLDAVKQLIPEVFNFGDAVGLVVALDVTSQENVPPFANSAVDGFAVRTIDMQSVPATLRVVGELAAGAAPNIGIGHGETIRIMTGAPIPDGCDAVVMVEDSAPGTLDNEVVLRARVEKGQAIRPAGDDVVAGDVVFRVGDVLTPGAVGVLASINARRVVAIPRARVAVLSTGDELIDDGSPLQLGQIRESNKTMLIGLVEKAGCEAIDYGIVRDDEARLEEVLREAAANCDAIVTSGGVSMGDYDVVKAVLNRIADMKWMQIAIKPAKPFAFGNLFSASEGDFERVVPVFGLPGNPVSSLVSFEVIARPALRKMMGHNNPQRRPVKAIADTAFPRKVDGKVHLPRVVVSVGADGRLHASSVGNQGSHQLAATAMANALGVLPDGTGVAAGDELDVILLDALP